MGQPPRIVALPGSREIFKKVHKLLLYIEKVLKSGALRRPLTQMGYGWEKWCQN